MEPRILREEGGKYVIVDNRFNVFGKPHKTWRSARHSLHTINEIIEAGGIVLAQAWAEHPDNFKAGGTD